MSKTENKRDLASSIDLNDVDEEKKKKILKINENVDEVVEDGNEEDMLTANEDDDHQLNIESLSIQLGLKERINKNFTRFFGSIKQIPGDFIVNEIDSRGNVVHLTNFDMPVIEKKEVEKELTQAERIEMTNNIKRIIGEEIQKNLIDFLETNTKESSFKFEAPKNKDDRKLFHDFMKLCYKQHNSNTTTENNNQYIEISHNKFRRTSMRDCYKNNNYSNRDIDNFKFCECAMYKENIDTIQAVNLIVKHLRINSKRIGYAGTKDKKAKTTQLLTFFKIDPTQLARLNSNLHNIKLGNFTLRNGENLKLGDLSGNRFKIVIRDIKSNETTDQSIKDCIESLRTNGFINYFGLQRFGNCHEIPTHLIGKCLIQNKIKEAIELILKPRDMKFEKREIKKAREVWESSNHDPMRALVYIEKINCIEKYILNGLSKCGQNDYLGAFQFIPRNMRLMYLHAYQSFIWNEAASKRIQLFGLKPVVGDLAIKKTENYCQKIEGEEKKTVLIDETNISEFNIEDVVLPLPGHAVLYPQNELMDFYKSILAKDDLRIDSFRNKIKDFSLSGDYRHVIIKASNVDFKIINYSNKSMEIAKSDWDLIKPKNNQEETIGDSSENLLKAVLIEYSLPSSCYATVALREVLDDNSKL